jgi:hypothetical protein
MTGAHDWMPVAQAACFCGGCVEDSMVGARRPKPYGAVAGGLLAVHLPGAGAAASGGTGARSLQLGTPLNSLDRLHRAGIR